MQCRTIVLGIRSFALWSTLMIARLAWAADSTSQDNLLPPLTRTRLVIVLSIILLMVVLFIVLFWWQKHIEQAGYFARIYEETIRNMEFTRLAAGYQQRWAAGAYIDEILNRRSPRGAKWAEENEQPQPRAEFLELAKKLDRVDQVRQVQWSTSLPGLGAGGFGAGGFGGRNPFVDTGSVPARPSDGREQAVDPQQEMAFSDMRRKFENATNVWLDRANSHAWDWYQKDLDKAKKDAQAQAKRALQVDFSALRGRGPEFALEFTAIVIIIFAAVILGVIGGLTSQQIGTLLAAIAGYVLGKGAARGGSGQQLEVSVKTPEGKPPEEKPPEGKGKDATHPEA